MKVNLWVEMMGTSMVLMTGKLSVTAMDTQLAVSMELMMDGTKVSK